MTTPPTSTKVPDDAYLLWFENDQMIVQTFVSGMLQEGVIDDKDYNTEKPDENILFWLPVKETTGTGSAASTATGATGATPTYEIKKVRRDSILKNVESSASTTPPSGYNPPTMEVNIDTVFKKITDGNGDTKSPELSPWKIYKIDRDEIRFQLVNGSEAGLIAARTAKEQELKSLQGEVARLKQENSINNNKERLFNFYKDSTKELITINKKEYTSKKVLEQNKPNSFFIIMTNVLVTLNTNYNNTIAKPNVDGIKSLISTEVSKEDFSEKNVTNPQSYFENLENFVVTESIIKKLMDKFKELSIGRENNRGNRGNRRNIKLILFIIENSNNDFKVICFNNEIIKETPIYAILLYKENDAYQLIVNTNENKQIIVNGNKTDTVWKYEDVPQEIKDKCASATSS